MLRAICNFRTVRESHQNKPMSSVAGPKEKLGFYNLDPDPDPKLRSSRRLKKKNFKLKKQTNKQKKT